MTYRAPRFLFRRHEVMRRVRAGDSFLEIGAGNLTLTRELLGVFQSGLAIDFTDDLEESYAALPAELQSRLDISRDDFMAVDPGGPFDCVIACEVLEHVEQDQRFVERVFAALKPGGQAILSVPAKQKYWSVHDELVGHLRRYEKAGLADMLDAAGFADVDVVAYGYPWINLLSHLRVGLAKRTLTERSDWSAEQQTKMSNHRQIPAWLSGGLVPLLLNTVTVYPFALFSRAFNRRDLSDGYVVTMRRPDGV